MTSSHPIANLLDLLGRRWTLRILWELRAGDRLSFGELQRRCDGMSTSVLDKRLGELCEHRIVARTRGGRYALTAQGRRLRGPLLALNDWARSWRC